MSPSRRKLLVRRGLALSVLGTATAATAACGLLLGIDDVPAVRDRDAAPNDVLSAPEVDRDHHLVDRSVRDGRTEHVVEAAAEATLEAAPPGALPGRTGTQTTSTAEVNLAFRQIWVGDTDKTSAFNVDPSAWITFGYNIDGKVTTETSTDVCTLASGAPPTIQIDGMNGFDDSFGENLVSVLGVIFPGVSKLLTGVFESGNLTVMLDTTGLTQSPTQTNIGLQTRVFGGATFDGTPTFTLADNWPIDPTSLANSHSLANGPKVQFDDSYIVDGTWVSGSPSTFAFSVQLGGVPLAIVLHQAVLTFQDTVDDAGAHHAINGVAAGLLDPKEFLADVQIIAARTNQGQYCSLLPFAEGEVLHAQDILHDATNSAGSPCDAISLAVAFTADQIQPPSVVGVSNQKDASLTPCDAGLMTDAGGGSD